MNFFTFDYPIIDEQVFFLDLCYTTEEQGETWHWFLCLTDGNKYQFKQESLDRMKPIEFSDIPLTMEIK